MGKRKIIDSQVSSFSVAWPEMCIGCGTTNGKLKKRKEYFKDTKRKGKLGHDEYNTVTIKPMMHICPACESKAYGELEKARNTSFIVVVVIAAIMATINLISISWGSWEIVRFFLNIILGLVGINYLMMAILYNSSSPSKAFFKLKRKNNKARELVLELRNVDYANRFESMNPSFGRVLIVETDKPFAPKNLGKRMLDGLNNL